MKENPSLYLFNDLSETAKQKALESLEKPFIEIDENTVWDTEGLIEKIDELWFYEDGTFA